MSTVIGVDSSTQSCKVLTVDAESGTILDSATASHPEGTAVDPGAWTTALRQAWHDAGIADDGSVAGVSVAGQQHGMVALDEQNRPVHDALLWNDTRSAPEAAELHRELGSQAWIDAVNVVPVASFTLTKLAWLARHRPELADRVRRVVLPHDWLNYQLTGEFFTDRSDASGTCYYSPVTNEYRPDLLERFFGTVPRLPAVVGSGEAGGSLLSQWSAASAAGTGPSGNRTVVGAGAGDNAGAALGLGLSEGEVAVSVGTSGTVFVSAAQPVSDPSGAVAGFADATGQHLPLLAMINSARVLTATAGMLGTGLQELDRLALDAPLDAEGLTLLPYLDGERTPNLPEATGTLTGMRRTNMTDSNLARAGVLGVLNSLADALDLLAGHGVPVRKVLLIGGGAKSQALQQAAADVLRVPVEVPVSGEYVARGAARQAAWAATGQLPQWERRIEASFEPDADSGWADEVRDRYVAARRQVYGV
ncbi:xylulokinase [Arthrobacter castelli]|uniref:xylulokinase n=1 Tax=Arthrobacter castelli TaxID=271431 RepID=UPI000425238F|nr:xylulokinase [Arthrobacter castelli]